MISLFTALLIKLIGWSISGMKATNEQSQSCRTCVNGLLARNTLNKHKFQPQGYLITWEMHSTGDSLIGRHAGGG